MSGMPGRVTLVEVGPRDGLQNEPSIVPTPVKIEFINRLTAAGLKTIESTSFVRAPRIPQLADAEKVCAGIKRGPDTTYPVLVPNEIGMERALACGVTDIAVFSAASNTFNQRNINATIAESIERFKPVMKLARANEVRVRGYISCVLGCPYEGDIDVGTVSAVAKDLVDLGCYEISLGDTIGVGTPLAAQKMVEAVAKTVGLDKLAVHFHDTRGQSLANILACLEVGVTTVDASVAGLGGCPYADGASGNVASEDVLYMLDGMGIETGVDMGRLIDAGRFICDHLGKKPASKTGLLTKI